MSVQPNQQLTLDASQEKGFISFHNSLPEKPAVTVRFFDRSDYYTAHGEDALFVARELYKSLAVVKFLGSSSQKLPSVVLSKSNFENFVRELLLVRQYRIEVYKNKGNNKNNDNWSVEFKASPGNLTQFEELLFGNVDLSSLSGIIAIKIGLDNGQRRVGVGYCDAMMRKFLVCEFLDNDHLTNLETVIVQLGPKECILPAGEATAEYSKAKQVAERNGLLVTERKKGEFSTKDCVQDLNRLLKFHKGQQESAASLQEMELTLAMSGIAAAIKYLELLSDDGNFNQFTFTNFDMGQYVHLDSSAVRALNLMPTPQESGRTENIFGILNHCRTPQGQRLLAQWIKQPLLDINKIEERLNVVEALVQDSTLRQVLLDDHLRRIVDFNRLSKKFQKKKATLCDCYRVYQAIKRLPNLVEVLENSSSDNVDVLKSLFSQNLGESIKDFVNFQEMVQTTLDMGLVDSGEYLIKPEFDEKLQELRENMDKLQEDIRRQLKKVAADLGLEAQKTVKLEFAAQIGYHFRVTKKDEKALRNNRSYDLIDTKNSGVRFRSKGLTELNTDFMQVREEYNEQQKSVVAEVMNIASGYSEPMQTLSDNLAQLDVLTSFAAAATTAPTPFVRPKLLPQGSGLISMKQIRHPCLELQDSIAFIPNDVHFERHKQMLHIITGPNMGGKSTYIRSVGVAILMAQIGSFVPCESAEISLVDRILARVGASDCMLKGVSTFMAEMLDTASILQSATDNSLVIIDELGRGTSTYDGFGLAWAISEHISKEIKSFCLFATHFHELTTLAEEVPSVNNLHVAALTTADKLTLLYQVRQGVCDQSFGIHVAELAHFPKHVIEYAKQKANELEDYHYFPEGIEESGDGTKLQRETQEEGEKLMEEFMVSLSKLPVSTMSDEELTSAVKKLKQELKSADNGFIKYLIKS